MLPRDKGDSRIDGCVAVARFEQFVEFEFGKTPAAGKRVDDGEEKAALQNALEFRTRCNHLFQIQKRVVVAFELRIAQPYVIRELYAVDARILRKCEKKRERVRIFFLLIQQYALPHYIGSFG